MQFSMGRSIATTSIQSSAIHELVTSQVLGANGVFISDIRKRLGAVYVDSVNLVVYTDQPGTMYLEESDDNGTWSIIKTQTVSALTLVETGIVKVNKMYYRVRYVNGATAQNQFTIYEIDIAGLSNVNANLTGSTVALPVDIQFSAVKVTPVTLVSAMAITDTVRHWAANPTDWSAWKSMVLRADNTHNQPVDVYLNFVNNGDFNKFDGTPMKITIPANKSYVLVTPNDFPILGQTIADPVAIGLQCATAPTSGSITIVAYPTPIV